MGATPNTIAAVATAPGIGGIAIVRVSGPDSLGILRRLTNVRSIEPNFIKSAVIYTADKAQKLDHGMVAYFKAPRSFTGEDSAEFFCHGSLFLANRILAECLKSGARLAEPGEFTKKAFLAGKIDLTQAEAISEMLAAKTDLGAQLALHHLEGDVSKKVKKLRQDCILILAEIEAALDFPEEIADPAKNFLIQKFTLIQKELELLYANSKKGVLINNGISIVLAGRTNAGKSSLFNALAGESRAIVTEIHGTTRDYLEAEISLQGIKARLFDTAGLRTAKDKVEQLGIERSLELIASAEIVLLVVDAEIGLQTEEQNILAKLKNKNVLVVINKTDLFPDTDYPGAIKISAKTGEGLAVLEKKILELMDINDLDISKNVFVSSIRQQEKLIRAGEKARKALSSIQNLEFLDLLAVELKDLIYYLGEITGDEVNEEVISHIFENFCVGK